MWFTDSDTHARHDFIDKTLENFEEVVTHEEMQTTLGEANVANAMFLATRLTVPNVRHGKIKSVPRTSSAEGLPIVVLRENEEVVIDKSLLSPMDIQLFSATDKSEAWFKDRTKKKIGDYLLSATRSKESMSLRYRQKAAAYVLSQETRFELPTGNGKNSYRYLRSRPFTVLQQKDDDTGSRFDPSALYHELVHVEQAVIQPIQRYDSGEALTDEGYRRELEAYHRQIYFIRGMVNMGYTPTDGEKLYYTETPEGVYSVAARIDNLRRETNAARKDAFFPNGTLKKKLKEVGVDIVE